MSKYSVTLRAPIRVGVTAFNGAFHAFEDAADEDGLVELERVCEICKEYGVAAQLYSPNGQPKGTVDVEGNYTLQ